MQTSWNYSCSHVIKVGNRIVRLRKNRDTLKSVQFDVFYQFSSIRPHCFHFFQFFFFHLEFMLPKWNGVDRIYIFRLVLVLFYSFFPGKSANLEIVSVSGGKVFTGTNWPGFSLFFFSYFNKFSDLMGKVTGISFLTDRKLTICYGRFF